MEVQELIQANANLTADNAALAASLGRMTAERDTLVEQRDELRGKVIALQQARAELVRAADGARKLAADRVAKLTAEHAEQIKTLKEARDRVNQLALERNKILAEELDSLREQLTTAQRERDAALAELSKYDPQRQADRAAAELRAIEAEERKRDAEAQERRRRKEAILRAMNHEPRTTNNEPNS